MGRVWLPQVNEMLEMLTGHFSRLPALVAEMRFPVPSSLQPATLGFLHSLVAHQSAPGRVMPPCADPRSATRQNHLVAITAFRHLYQATQRLHLALSFMCILLRLYRSLYQPALLFPESYHLKRIISFLLINSN
jgi:hypothetical protein